MNDLPAISGGKPAKTVPYRSQNRYGEEELIELKEALEQGTLFYARGRKTKQLEAEFAAAIGCKYAIATSSGTVAIHTALIAAGISPGDEVIVPPITDMGCVLPILWQSAIPVFADLDPHTYNLDPAAVEAAITPKTRAILAVHLAGNACDVPALQRISAKHQISLIEDCAQAHGCMYDRKPVGQFGLAGCFSYNEFKHISCGDGGLVLTNDDAFALKARQATDKGYNRSATLLARNPTFLANNYRMTELQAAVARAQLRKLPSIIERRCEWCLQLSAKLVDIKGLHLPRITPNSRHSWWFYLMRVDAEQLGATVDDFAAALAAEGLPVSPHYHGRPVYHYPIFVQHSAYPRGQHPFVARNYPPGLCPVAEKILDTCIQLAINENYSTQDLDETVHAFTRVAEWFRSRS
ncbi:MAG: DegT/DnrJ/EryC1/StrS family aminotransferase [Phycisphaerales bacterium]|nr:DegT/DnrJ/EryC1/StrS family aminotransferase [Phycisphaerales bacterium]